ncbi:hypothetical protein EI94DRAFT_1708005 [Lactarius quietus]|nr:hypothetical protein EI94DRAFT_1708005 [Lactarius quietus]
MPQSRDVIILVAVPGMDKVITTHTKTKTGRVRTKEKIIPLVLPKEKGSVQSSKSNKKCAQPEPQDMEPVESGSDIPIVDSTNIQYFDDQQDDLLEHVIDDSHTTASTPMDQWVQIQNRQFPLPQATLLDSNTLYSSILAVTGVFSFSWALWCPMSQNG